MHFKSIYLFPIILLLLSSCDPARKATTDKLRKKPASFVLKRLDKQAFSSDWLAAKGKISIDYQGQKVGATLTLRMQKDNVIWAQVKKLSFEIGRMKVTPDSLYVLDRFNQQYVAAGIEELARFTSAPINFQMMQDLIFGRSYFWSRDGLESSVDGQTYQLDQDYARTKSKYLVGGDFLLQQQNHMLDEYGAEIRAEQGNYPSQGLTNFAYFRSYQVEGPASIDLDLNFSKVVIDEAQTFPFSIPAHYTPLALN